MKHYYYSHIHKVLFKNAHQIHATRTTSCDSVLLPT